MHNRGNYFWGIILVLLGGLLLMDNLGLLPRGVNVWGLFWPIILIGFGVRGIMQATSSRPVADRGMGAEGGQTPWQSPEQSPSQAARPGEGLRLPLEGARSATVRLHHGAGELRIDDRAADDELLSGAFVGGVEHEMNRSLEHVTVDLRVPSGAIGPMMPFDSQPLNWTVGFNPNVPLYLELEVGASRNRLDLRNLQVKDLRLQTGASETDIDLPERGGQLRATIRSGAASVNIRVPENVSALIRARGGLSTTDIDTTRFPPTGNNEYRSPDYEVAANRVELDIETGLGSVSIK